MPMKDLLLMVMPDDRVWVDSESFVRYLRAVQDEASAHASAAREDDHVLQFAGVMAVHDILGQIADGIVLTQMEAVEELRGRRVT